MLRTALSAACLFIVSTANAYTDSNPLTFSVEADSDYPLCCNVYKGPVMVSTAFSDLFIRGMAEFSLLGPLGYSGEQVYLSFSYLDSYSLGSTPFASPVSVSAYIGDNIAARSDYGVATFASLGTFQSTGLVVGDRITYDVTSIFQYATGAGAPSLGFRLAVVGFTGGPTKGASFGSFALTPAIPEPSEYALMLAGLAAVGMTVRRKRARVAA